MVRVEKILERQTAFKRTGLDLTCALGRDISDGDNGVSMLRHTHGFLDYKTTTWKYIFNHDGN